MNNINKTILLAEQFGADFNYIDFSYISDILKSKEYQNLLINVKWAEKFPLVKAVRIVDDFKALNYNIKSFEETIILANRINYLFLTSSEKYYLNPLIKYDFAIKTSSIGELMIPYEGSYHSINEMILDNTHNISYKSKAIVSICENFRNEINANNQENLQLLKDNKGIKHIVYSAYFYLVLKEIFTLICLILSFSIFIVDLQIFNDFINIHSPNNIFTHLLLAFLCETAILLIITIFSIGYLANVTSPFFYFKKAANKSINRRFKNININAQHLANYLLEACKNNIPLKNDISKFASHPFNNNEFDKYKEIFTFKKKNIYTSLNYLFLLTFVFIILTLVVTIIIYFVSRG